MNLIGQNLGNYQITGFLGEGGMASVYRAHQAAIKRDVAIKLIKVGMGDQAQFMQRFAREAQTVAALNHPHIVKVFDYGQEGDLAYLVMELQPGGSLANLIEAGQIPTARIAAILDQVASALDYAHRQGIVHRDLKPQNILLDPDGNAILTDFGIAKLLNVSTASLTQSGVAIGTPTYMAPEQWQGLPVDGRTDIYALGVVLYQMLSGQLPFQGDTPFSVMHKHIYDTPPSVISDRPQLPPAVDQVLRTALAKSPDDRYKTAGEMAIAFRAALAGQSLPMSAAATAVPTGTTTSLLSSPATAVLHPAAASASRRGSPTLLIAVGLIVVALLVIGGGAALLSGKSSGTATSTTGATSAPTTVVAMLPSTMPVTTAATMAATAINTTMPATTAVTSTIMQATAASTAASVPLVAALPSAVTTSAATMASTMAVTSSIPTAAATMIMATTAPATMAATTAITAAPTLRTTVTATVSPTASPTNSPTNSPTATATVLPAVGNVVFANQAKGAFLDSLTFTLAHIPLPNEGQTDVAWLTDRVHPPLRLGKLQVRADGTAQLTYTDPKGANLLATYNAAYVTAQSGATPTAQDTILYSGAIPALADVHVQHVLSRFPDTPGNIGLMTGAVRQANILTDHVNLLSEAIKQGNVALTRLHMEHIYNILTGTDGAKDINGDGALTISPPGDGYGLLNYLTNAVEHANLMTQQPDATPDMKVIARRLAVAIANITTNYTQMQTLIIQAATKKTIADIKPLMAQVVILNTAAMNGTMATPDPDAAQFGGMANVYAQAVNFGTIALFPGDGALQTAMPTAATMAATMGTMSMIISAASSDAAATPAATLPAGAVVIQIQGETFVPDRLTVKAGTPIIFINQSNEQHTATADNGSFATGVLDPGGQSKPVVLTTPGSYAYYCEFHGGQGNIGMSATIIVQ